MIGKKISRFVWLDDDIEVIEKAGVRKDTPEPRADAEESEMQDIDAIPLSLSGQSIPPESRPGRHPQDNTEHQHRQDHGDEL